MKTLHAMSFLAVLGIVGCSISSTPTDAVPTPSTPTVKVIGNWELLKSMAGEGSGIFMDFLPGGIFATKPAPTSDTFKGTWSITTLGDEIEITLNKGTHEEGKYIVTFGEDDKMAFQNPKDRHDRMAFVRKKS